MKKMTLISLVTLLALVLTAGIGFAAEPITVRGHITDDNQLMTEDGEFYDIGDTEEGEQLMEMVGEKVEVRGTLIDNEDTKEIQVESFIVVK